MGNEAQQPSRENTPGMEAIYSTPMELEYFHFLPLELRSNFDQTCPFKSCQPIMEFCGTKE